MGWANHLIEQLKRGETVQCRPRGGSMKGYIESGQLVTIEPFKPELTYLAGGGSKLNIKRRDIVLCSIEGTHLLHLVSEVRMKGCQIMNAFGKRNGFAPWESIYGKVIKVED